MLLTSRVSGIHSIKVKIAPPVNEVHPYLQEKTIFCRRFFFCGLRPTGRCIIGVSCFPEQWGELSKET